MEKITLVDWARNLISAVGMQNLIAVETYPVNDNSGEVYVADHVALRRRVKSNAELRDELNASINRFASR